MIPDQWDSLLLGLGLGSSSRTMIQDLSKIEGFVCLTDQWFKEIQDQFPKDTIMVVRKSFYRIPEAGTHW